MDEERLDRLGRHIVRASASDDGALAVEVAASPFLYTRVRARIESERVRRAEGEGWLALLGVVWRAAPAMSLAAVFAVGLFFFTSFDTGNIATSTSVEGLLRPEDASVEYVVFTDNRAPLSGDDVLETIMVDYDAAAEDAQ